MKRILEPEVMDTEEEAIEYDAMDFAAVNQVFAELAISLAPIKGKVLDAGTGTARIPILICQQRPDWQIIAIDLAKSMLKIGEKNIKQAGLEKQIELKLADAKQMPYPTHYFDGIISNSLVHHLPKPLVFFQEIKRVLKPDGAILIRDLIRPYDRETINKLVADIGTDYDEHQKKLFFDSLQAALTLDEVRELLIKTGLQKVNIYQSSDRHWTIERRKK